MNTRSLLNTIQMLKYFSHFGMRALLILFLVEQLGFSKHDAYSLNSLFCSLVALGGVLGGLLADSLIGTRLAMKIGLISLTIGYSALIYEPGLYIALGFITSGYALFSGNSMALLSETYKACSNGHIKGFTLLYMFQNLGALLSTIACGYVGMHYGFLAGFALAASGMYFASLLLLCNPKALDGLGNAPKRKNKTPSLLCVVMLLIFMIAPRFSSFTLTLLPICTIAICIYFAIQLLRARELPKNKVVQLFMYFAAIILFYSMDDQICSSLMLYAENETNRSLFGMTFPSSILMTLNPIVIMIMGRLFMRSWPLLIPFVITSAAFSLFLFHPPFSGILAMVVMITIAELMIIPPTYALASEVAAHGKAGVVMGMIPLVFSIAYLGSGMLSKMVCASGSYNEGYIKIACLALLGGIKFHYLKLLPAKRLFNKE